MNKFALYEASVQEPEVHLKLFKQFYFDLCGDTKKPTVLREDFCSTYWIASQWVKEDKEHSALALDLDDAPLKWAQSNRFQKLEVDQKQRLHILKKDVRTVTKQKAHLIVACNFSFYIFHARGELLKYFLSARKSLVASKDKRPEGLLILEMAGGPGMIAKMKESRIFRLQGKRIKYTWDQKSFDPVHRRAQYAIHFKWGNGEHLDNAFTYDWRIWTIPEVREVLLEAGFKDVKIFWEQSHKGEGTGEFACVEQGDNDFAWISYVVGTV